MNHQQGRNSAVIYEETFQLFTQKEKKLITSTFKNSHFIFFASKYACEITVVLNYEIALGASFDSHYVWN